MKTSNTNHRTNVQEYQAAKDQRSNKPGLMTGMFSTLDDPPDLDHPTLDPSTLSLAAPWASKEVKIPILEPSSYACQKPFL